MMVPRVSIVFGAGVLEEKEEWPELRMACLSLVLLVASASLRIGQPDVEREDDG